MASQPVKSVAGQRGSSIDIHVPELADVLAPWRNPTLGIATLGVPPHISLLYPWQTPPLTIRDVEVVRAAVVGFTAFPISFSTIRRFPPTVLYLALDDDSGVKALMQAMRRAFPAIQPYGGQIADPIPHLTVAKAQTDAELDQLEREMLSAFGVRLPMAYQVEQIVVMEEGLGGQWRDFASIRLGVSG